MQLDRRQFLKLASVTGALVIPAVLGYELVQDAQGELPPRLSPYAPVEILESWPSEPGAASPLLLLINEQADSPFGLYLAEILRAEGLNLFQIARLSDIASAPLDWYDLILLAQGPVSTNQTERLEAYVANGGRLVAMRPDVRLAPLLGVEPLGANTSESYVQVDPSHPVAQGIATRALQYHGTADHYRLAGAQAVAWLAGADDLPTALPAVTIHRYGQGQAALWAFDLAHSVALTRQGNPAWANQERDGGDGIRAPDMFIGWIDLDRIHIPQADEQQCLLANLLAALSQGKRPLPRLWYFPGPAESMFIITGDCHGHPPSAVEAVLARAEQRGGHMSIYYTAYPHGDLQRAAKRAVLRLGALPILQDAFTGQFTSSPTRSDVADWRTRGHEFGLHPYVEEGLDLGWARYWEEFTGLGYGPVPPTVRTHRILWTGWVETARIQATHGIRLNLDYYHWGPALQKGNGEWVSGHLTGSGLPMRFVDEQGRILGIYQQLTQLTDDHWLDVRFGGCHWGAQARLGAEAALEMSKSLLRDSLSDHCAIVANFHPDLFHVGPAATDERSHATAARWFEGTLDCAAEHGIPIWSAAEWLDFTDVRCDTVVDAVQWQPVERRLSFRVSARPVTGGDLTVMIPLHHQNSILAQVELDGLTFDYRERTVGGVRYGCITPGSGSHQVMAAYS